MAASSFFQARTRKFRAIFQSIFFFKFSLNCRMQRVSCRVVKSLRLQVVASSLEHVESANHESQRHYDTPAGTPLSVHMFLPPL